MCHGMHGLNLNPSVENTPQAEFAATAGVILCLRSCFRNSP